MSALYQTANEVRSEVNLAHKLLIAAVLLFAVFIVLCNTDNEFTALRPLDGVVIAKVPANRDVSQDIVSVRSATGDVIKVQATEAQFKHTVIGTKWTYPVSDSSLGYPVPFKNKLLIAAVLLCAVGAFGCVVKLLTLFDYR
jgi:hypothetical protein